MDEESNEPSLEADGEGKKTAFRPSRMAIMQPCDDLHRYLVDKFHVTKSKTVLFEEIDLSTYKPTAKVASFSTSEDRLLVWIKTFAIRYYNHLNTMGYRVSWQEQESYSCPTKSDKIILHIYALEDNNEEQIITLSIFISTGRIMVQGKRFAEWSHDEFPTLLSIVNSLATHSLEDVSSTNTPMFLMALSKFFTKCQDHEANTTNTQREPQSNAGEASEAIPEEDATHDDEIRETTETTETREMSDLTKPLTFTPNKLKTITTLRNTVGNLEAEFIQFKMTTSGNIEQLKDKTVQQDHLFKVHKTTVGGLSDDVTNNNKLLTEELQKNAALISKLQDDHQALQKKHAKITEDNVTMLRKQRQLEEEVVFLKDQVKALWEKLNSQPPEAISKTNASSQTTPVAAKNDTSSTITKENTISTSPLAACKADELLIVDLPTFNSFSPLQEHPTEPLEQDKQENTRNSRHPTAPTTAIDDTLSNEVFFLCDSNGKFLDTRPMFSSSHEVKYVRAPLIKHARACVQNDIRTAPQMIVIHTGTNDLEKVNSPDELIANILTLITETSTKFPSSKILFSTLLPRKDISAATIISINNQLITSCSQLSNVKLISHENLFVNGLNILHDNKHILRRHIGLFAKNLKDAIHGRTRPRATSSSHMTPGHRSPHDHSTTPQIPNMMRHASYSTAVKSTPPFGAPYHPQMQPPPIPTQHFKPTLQQQIPLAPHQTGQAPHQLPHASHQTFPHAAKMETAHELPSNHATNTQMPQELISFLRFVKSFL